jgi:lipoprotein NlpD
MNLSRDPFRILCVAALLLVVAGCATKQPAPVVARTPPPPRAEAPKPVPEKPAEKAVATHTVKRGETLAGIALQYGLDYRELAAWNGITNPNVISVGQVLSLAATNGVAAAPVAAPTATPLAAPAPIEARPLANTEKLKVEPRGQRLPYSDKALAQLSAGDPPASAPTNGTIAPPVPSAVGPGSAAGAAAPPVSAPVMPAPAEPERPVAGTQGDAVDWIWPVKGKVVGPFTESSKGIDIAGKKGTAVAAAAAGRVVYVGEGVRGLGKLVIVKHNDTWLSAYGHNDSIAVKEQQDVKRGQKIAVMGSSDTDQVKLHFEIRRHGKPVDPAKMLPPP